MSLSINFHLFSTVTVAHPYPLLIPISFDSLPPTFFYFFFTVSLASFDSEADTKTFIRGGKKVTDRDGPGRDVIGGRAGEVYKLDSRGGPGQSQSQGTGKGKSGGPQSEMDRMLEELKVSLKDDRWHKGHIIFVLF